MKIKKIFNEINKKGRKKGSIILMSLPVITMIIVFTAVVFNIMFVYHTLNQVLEGAEEGARVRAQAIDIPLKEYTGIVEVFHKNTEYDDGVTDYTMHENVDMKIQNDRATGHLPIANPYHNWDIYSKAYEAAEAASKVAVIESIEATIGTDNLGVELVDMEEGNICFDVHPLPDDSSYVTFECETDYGKITETIYVSGKNQNTYPNPDPRKDDFVVHNVVFIGIKFQYRHIITKPLENLGWVEPPVKIVTSIAYPQVDVCFGGNC